MPGTFLNPVGCRQRRNPWRVQKALLENEKVLSLAEDLFAEGDIVLKDHKSRTVTLKSRKTGHFVKVSFEGFPSPGETVSLAA